jgi:dTDP-4-amino-4,6-dideoxygalactose transaminase
MMKNHIRLSKSCVGLEESIALSKVVETGYLGMGSEVNLFENELREFIDTDKEVICTNSGTSALHLAVQCLGIGQGDEVLVPSITYLSSFQAISATGAKPVLVDVTENRVFIDLRDAEYRISEKTKAIMPVHYASDSQEMYTVYTFAKKYGLRVIEDAAHSFGSIRNGKIVGAEGDIVCFSFDGIKNITSGEGGAVVTGDRELAELIKDARLLGIEKDTEKRYQGLRSWQFDVNHQGWRYHMSNLMATIGRVQLKKLDKFATHRKKCCNQYLKKLKDLTDISLLDLDYDNNVPHIFVVRVLNGMRDGLMGYLKNNGIECGIHYQPGHTLSLYQVDYKLQNSDKLGTELLSLPLHAELTETEMDEVICAVCNYLNGKERSNA